VQRGGGAGHDEVGRNSPWFPVIGEAEKGIEAAVFGCGGGALVTSDELRWVLQHEGGTRSEEGPMAGGGSSLLGG
jgi:hypothetical protein